jgi:two-component system catabolic regulation response regulator CreB
VLVVDDDDTVREVLRRYLTRDGHEVIEAADGITGLGVVRSQHPDLVVLDLMLPGMDGLEVCREIRRTSSIPVIMLTALGQESDRVVGLEYGADDYVVKPFSPRELSARVKAVLRRTQPTTDAAPAASPTKPLWVDSAKRQVTFYGVLLQLSKFEYEIIATFIERPGQVFSREQLMNRIWEQPEQSLDRTVDAHIKNLRAKLRAVRPDLDPIVTHRGSGYSLREEP